MLEGIVYDSPALIKQISLLSVLMWAALGYVTYQVAKYAAWKAYAKVVTKVPVREYIPESLGGCPRPPAKTKEQLRQEKAALMASSIVAVMKKVMDGVPDAPQAGAPEPAPLTTPGGPMAVISPQPHMIQAH